MYVPYQCCQKSLEDYYLQQTGNGLNFYRGSPYQKGFGLGGLFRSFFRAAVPLFKSGAKAVGKQLFHSGVDLLNDVTQGHDVKTAAKRRLKEAGNVLADKASTKVKSMIGSGKRNKKRKRTRAPVITRRAKKEKTHDIFS
jgi:hypothetical protein